jgi:hypothetical protein
MPSTANAAHPMRSAHDASHVSGRRLVLVRIARLPRVVLVVSVDLFVTLVFSVNYSRRLHPGRQWHWMICSPSV